VCFRSLPIGRPTRRAKVADGVPALDDDHAPLGPVEQANVDRVRSLGGTRGQLELAVEACRPAQAQDEFLDGQVSRVSRGLGGVSTEHHAHVDAQRVAKEEPIGEWRSCSTTELQVGQTRTTDTDPLRQRRLREPATDARGPGSATELDRCRLSLLLAPYPRLCSLATRHVDQVGKERLSIT